MTKIPLRRFTARALPINQDGKVLLLHGFNPARPDTPFWFTVGGATEGDEALVDAATRELFEEAGITASTSDFTGPLGTSTIEFDFAEYAITQDQTFFAVRVGEVAVSYAHMEQIEKETTLGHRWWSIEDLETTTETFFPADLPAILRKITWDAAPE
ncbi:NUDIX domain-containing protein [Nonomuraea sp. NBC_01738]|uniref:NUDIX hydrolase n=1 Tax=Nonomuraea sp. NBC_01738 TaxID=2976003 RepID=UPI002E0D2344|nr:NUDIX domain-containing protein [Nonomuraea sp. NBC_01738]